MICGIAKLIRKGRKLVLNTCKLIKLTNDRIEFTYWWLKSVVKTRQKIKEIDKRVINPTRIKTDEIGRNDSSGMDLLLKKVVKKTSGKSWISTYIINLSQTSGRTHNTYWSDHILR